MFDASELQRLEGVFLASRCNDDLGPLYLALLEAGETLLAAYQRKKGFKLGIARRQIVIQDATTRLIEMYLKHPAQKSIPLCGRMHLELIFQLHNKKAVRADREGNIPLCHVAGARQPKPGEDIFLGRIADDPRVHGRRIAVDLYRAKYYKLAILAIAKYTPESWIRQHAVELRTIFLMTRGQR